MLKRVSAALAAIVLAACAPAATAPAPATAPSPKPAPVAPNEAPRDWQSLDDSANAVPGISAARAYRQLLAGRQPKDTVLVAVIDNGIDTAHADLRPHLWVNPREIVANGKDDDGNGYVDDIHGWDFIGGPDGRTVNHDTFEVTRLYARCGAGGAVPDSLAAAERARCAAIAADFAKKREEVRQTIANVQQISGIYGSIVPMLARALNVVPDSVTKERVERLQPADAEARQARAYFLQLASAGITPAIVAEARTEYQAQIDFGLNPAYNPRPIVGDDYANTAQRFYGNADVMGPGPTHGTHVGGIIGAIRDNALGIDGIASAVRIMMIRTVPDGDERDKDVANAIRYAVDNGARVINMSFGKAYSPQKTAVDSAVRYADAKGVLMIHAAGNDGEDAATNPSYPTPVYLDGGHASNWIEVGASGWRRDSLAASFSNFGRTRVDVFAPGVDILSTIPGGYERESGTSMAAPVVTGLAALILSYYPSLTPADVKRVIMESATSHAGQLVPRPGSETGEQVPFGTLSRTGGIVNAYAALKMAEELTRTHP